MEQVINKEKRSREGDMEKSMGETDGGETDTHGYGEPEKGERGKTLGWARAGTLTSPLCRVQHCRPLGAEQPPGSGPVHGA